jgi:ornithine carbamoyltransferase
MGIKAARRRFDSLPVAMLNTPPSRSVLPALLSAGEAAALLAHARALKAAAQSGIAQPLLRGKKLGLLCEAPEHPDAALFCHAAQELGAHVAHIRPRLDQHSPRNEVQHTARLLGRLYDAVECQGVPPELVRQMAQDAGVPMYEGIATAQHPHAQLAEKVGDGTPSDDDRRYVVQAMLLSTLA